MGFHLSAKVGSHGSLSARPRTHRFMLPPVILIILLLAISHCYSSQLVYPKVLNKIEKKYGSRAKRRILAWERLIANNQGKSTEKKLELVNNFFNLLQYVHDRDFIGQPEYWMTPVEFLSRGLGDCEDFAIAKYFTLRALGVADANLRLIYVKALRLNQAHMVLAYYPYADATPLILDNLNRNIKLASERNDLLPIYSFNGKGLWLAKRRGLGKRVGSSQRLSRWRGVLSRLRGQAREIK